MKNCTKICQVFKKKLSEETQDTVKIIVYK